MQFREHGEVPDNTLLSVVHQVTDYWRSQSDSVLHYQQEQFENAVQERQRVAYEQVVEIAAAAENRTAAHTLVQEATKEMMPRDAHSADVLSQSSSR